MGTTARSRSGRRYSCRAPGVSRTQCAGNAAAVYPGVGVLYDALHPCAAKQPTAYIVQHQTHGPRIAAAVRGRAPPAVTVRPPASRTLGHARPRPVTLNRAFLPVPLRHRAACSATHNTQHHASPSRPSGQRIIHATGRSCRQAINIVLLCSHSPCPNHIHAAFACLEVQSLTPRPKCFKRHGGHAGATAPPAAVNGAPRRSVRLAGACRRSAVRKPLDGDAGFAWQSAARPLRSGLMRPT